MTRSGGRGTSSNGGVAADAGERLPGIGGASPQQRLVSPAYRRFFQMAEYRTIQAGHCGGLSAAARVVQYAQGPPVV